MPICANCGASQPDGASFCDECGAPLQGPQAPVPAVSDALHARTVVASRVCPVCGAQTSSRDPFCTNCGAALDGAPRPDAGPTTLEPDETVVPAVAAAPQPQIVEVDIPAVVSDANGPTAARALICGHCGAELQPGSVFCEMCGTRVGAQEAPVAEPNVPALEGVRIPMAGPIPPGQVADPGLGMGGVLCWWAHPT